MIQLPHDFTQRMQDMLKEAYPAFLHSYDEEKTQALRVNTLKGTVSDFLQKKLFFDLKQVPWEPAGFYYDSHSRPGIHPLHEAGVYYIQEPSAMAPVTSLEAKSNEKILDLCAAPGGKTTQIAAYMQNKGLIVCNEIHPARAKILSENVERMGIRNAIVTNETPQRLSEAFAGYFDRVLVDAPCSGEGMFRKNAEACKQWSLENVTYCADRQDVVLDCASAMLRPGGRIVYATCTFAPLEDEGSVERFLARHSEYTLVEEHKMLPHLVKGEGHFYAVLQKTGDLPKGSYTRPAKGLQKGISMKEVKEFCQFQDEALTIRLAADEQQSGRKDCLLRFGEQLYLMPEEMPSIDKLKVLRPGLHLGTLRKNRFEPSHALALTLGRSDVKHCMELESETEINAYLNGMTVSWSGEKGWYLVTHQGYSIGWGKLSGQIMKNHYPKGKRRNWNYEED